MPAAVSLLALIGAHAAAVEADNIANGAEGWAVFDAAEDCALSLTIARDDEAAIFPDDAAALLYVARRALEGNPRHARALALHALADRLRILTWGPEWVDSRMGPPA